MTNLPNSNTKSQTVQTWLLVVVTLSVGAWLTSKWPNPAEVRAQPFVHVGQVGALVPLRTANLKVVRVDASSAVFYPQAGTNVARSQNGTFLVVGLELAAKTEPADVGKLAIEASDRRSFGGPPPVGQASCGPALPSVPLVCSLIFEVDKAALEGAKLRVPASVAGSGSGDDVALIDLGLDGARAKALAAQTKVLRVEPPQLRPRAGQP